MNEISRNYVKIIEWSDEDQCYVGCCPGLFYGGSAPAHLGLALNQSQITADERG